jgi:hypothetical protein
VREGGREGDKKRVPEKRDTACHSKYRGTSLIRKRTPLGPDRRPMPWVLGGSWGGGRFLMGEVPQYALKFLPEAGPSAPRRAYLSRGGPIFSEAGLFIPSGPICSEAGLCHSQPLTGLPLGLTDRPTVGP